MAKKNAVRKALKIIVHCLVVFLLINILWANFLPGSYNKLINFMLGIPEPPPEDFRIAYLDEVGTAAIITYITNMPVPKNVVDIPSEVDGYIVTQIGFGAFSGHNQISDITIPGTVTLIADMAFYSSSIRTVNIPDSVTHIGSEAFSYNNLSDITIPKSVQTLGSRAFVNNSIITISIPADVTLLNEIHPVFDNGFDEFYAEQGRTAGIYIYDNDTQSWSRN